MTEIKRRRLECGLTQKQLAEKVGVALSSVASWDRGEIRPSHKYFNALAEALACDVADIWTPPKTKSRTKRELSAEEQAIKAANREKVKPYIERREALGLSQTDLAAKIGVSATAIGNIESGRHFPRWEIRQKIRRALGMSEERFCSEEERNEIFFELENQGVSRYVIRKNYHKLRAINADFDDLYQDLAMCTLRAIDRYQPGERATLKSFVVCNMEFFIKQWIVKAVMHGLSGKISYPLPDVRVISLNDLMENGFDAVESMEDFTYTGEHHRKRPHTQPADQSVCV